MTLEMLVAIWVICGVIAAFIASSRKLSEGAGQWFVTGLVLGPFGVLWALVKR